MTHHIRRPLIALLATLALLPTPLRAQDAQQSPAWRFVDAQTLALLRVDLSTYDRPALTQWLTTTISNNTDPDTAREALAAMTDHPVVTFPQRLRDAGVREFYAVVSLSGIPHRSPAHLVVPLQPGTDPARIARAFLEAAGDTPDPAPANPTPDQPILKSHDVFALVRDNALILSSGDHARFNNFPAAPRPQLAQALAAAGNAPIAIAIAPDDDTRKVIEQMLPQLPPPANVPSSVLTRGLRSAHLAASLPPNPSLNLHIQSDSPEAAKNFHALLTQLLTTLQQHQGFRRDVPAADQLIPALTPKLDNDHLALSLDTPATNQVASFLAKGLAQAREQAMRTQSMVNLKQIGMGLMLYATERKGAYPDSLDQITPYLGDLVRTRNLFTNPRNPRRSPAYAYLKPPTALQDTPPMRMLAHETFDQWPAGGINVLFADGHVEFISDQNQFNTLLKEAQNPPPAKK